MPERAAEGEVASVLAALEALPDAFPSRERFIELITARGFPRAIADWLAMNVRRAGDTFRFRLPLPEIRALLADYFATDLWPVLERACGARRFDVVLGGRSPAFTAEDRARLDAIAANEPRVRVHVLERAGHWVHADDPDGLFAVMSASLA